MEGLTIVTLIGTIIMIATFSFLYYAEKSMKQ
jgi:hypothetical protein